MSDWLGGIAQGIVANALYAMLAGASGLLVGLWLLIRRVRARRRSLPLAVAYPAMVWMTYTGNPLDPMNSSIQVYCSVALYAVKRAMESPTALVITAPESPYESICRVEIGRVPSMVEARTWGPGLTYSGSIKFPERYVLLQAIAKTHGGKLPEIGPVFVEARVTLPTGTALAEHSKAGVQLGVPYSDPPRFTIRISNWPNGVPETWRQPSYMDFVR